MSDRGQAYERFNTKKCDSSQNREAVATGSNVRKAQAKMEAQPAQGLGENER